ncbi:uncharacterized protein LOC120014110 [Tripterygium wilfordii]|uniref:uncharacterized protein LOC120014110 n=1 Tax=Tripterygium wilfordii TaxID=458696 RepID=UPI0018F81207|nr:uncharacterized protein LOC120014110 [Tripterygium wilfordii]
MRVEVDGYGSAGCYDLLCSGFVQVNKKITLGGTIGPVSTYGGSQIGITLLVWKDLANGNWWVRYEDDKVLGYWPASLFTYLKDGASAIHWGGGLVNLKLGGKHTTTLTTEIGEWAFSKRRFWQSQLL